MVQPRKSYFSINPKIYPDLDTASINKKAIPVTDFNTDHRKQILTEKAVNKS